MKYFEKISALPNRKTIKYLPIQVPTSPGKRGRFFKTLSKRIDKINTRKGLA